MAARGWCWWCWRCWRGGGQQAARAGRRSTGHALQASEECVSGAALNQGLQEVA